MNASEGKFVHLGEAKLWMQTLTVGEVVKMKGEEFEVVEITDRECRLKLMSADERQTKQMEEMEEIRQHFLDHSEPGEGE